MYRDVIEVDHLVDRVISARGVCRFSPSTQSSSAQPVIATCRSNDVRQKIALRLHRSMEASLLHSWHRSCIAAHWSRVSHFTFDGSMVCHVWVAGDER